MLFRSHQHLALHPCPQQDASAFLAGLEPVRVSVFHHRVQPAAVLVPSFMLQPVVENAYSHGLKSCEEGGRILLRAWMQDKVLVLTVADNGKGMTPEELDAVQAKIVQSEQTGRSIGLGNISRRIGMLYPGGKMQVYSRAGHGTVVRFELPQTQQSEEKEETLS